MQHNTTTKDEQGNTFGQPTAKPFRVRLPGFIDDTEIGLGDVIKKTTHAMGIKAFGGCNRRAATLNRWMVFSGKRETHETTQP